MMSYRQHWIALYEKDRSDLRSILLKDPFYLWEGNRAPENRAERDLVYALEIACAEPGSPDCRSYLQRALAVVNRALREEKFKAGRCAEGFPRNRGDLLRVKAYTGFFLGGLLDQAALRQASFDYEERCKQFGPADWDSQLQAYCLTAIRVALLGGDMDHARRMLHTEKSFNWHAEEHVILKLLVENMVGTTLAESYRTALLPVFDAYFDRIRDPFFKPVVFLQVQMLRIEFAFLRDKYLISADGQIDRTRVLGSIAA